MPRNDADQLTVKAIVQIARGLGKRTIAEYVQDDDTTRMLRDYGVDMAQGFHLGRPVDAAETFALAA
jgi:EAL domain-containing protein (putative c-di-GMP-specific phosphodiesterase class I)